MRAYSVFDDLAPEAIKIMVRAGIAVTLHPKGQPRPSGSALQTLLEEYDVLLISTAETLTEAMFSRIERPKLIGTASSGVDESKKIRKSFPNIFSVVANLEGKERYEKVVDRLNSNDQMEQFCSAYILKILEVCSLNRTHIGPIAAYLGLPRDYRNPPISASDRFEKFRRESGKDYGESLDRQVRIWLDTVSENVAKIWNKAQSMMLSDTVLAELDRLLWLLDDLNRIFRPVTERKISQLPERTATATLHNLPPRLSNFTGRYDLLRSIHSGFSAESNLQILYGTSGIGKTQLAIEYAWKYRNEYDAVAFIRAGSRAELSDGCAKFLAEMGRSLEGGSPLQIMSAFHQFFRETRRWLIIFDNVDYLTDENKDDDNGTWADLESYFPRSGELRHILLTTVCDCNFREAKRFKVELFSESVSVEYLNKISGLCKQDEGAARLAKALGYLPLALIYAGSFIRQCNLQTYDEYLKLFQDEEKRVLGTKPRAVDYPRSIQNAFLLIRDKYISTAKDEQERLLHAAVLDFLNICAFVEPNDISLAPYFDQASGMPEALRAVFSSKWLYLQFKTALTEYSLFSYDSTTGLYYMHGLLQKVIQCEIPENERKKWMDYTIQAYDLQLKFRCNSVNSERGAIFNTLKYHTYRLLDNYLPYIDVSRAFSYFEHIFLHPYLASEEVTNAIIDSLKTIWENCVPENDSASRPFDSNRDYKAAVLYYLYNVYYTGDDEVPVYSDRAFRLAEDILSRFLENDADQPFDSLRIYEILHIYSSIFREKAYSSDCVFVRNCYRKIVAVAQRLISIAVCEKKEPFELVWSEFCVASGFMATLTDSTVIASISLPACSNRLDVTCKTMTVLKVFYPLPHEGDRESYESSIFDQEHIAKLEALDDPPKPPRADLRDVFNRVITDEDGLRKGDIIIQLPAKYADDNWQEELERLKKAPYDFYANDFFLRLYPDLRYPAWAFEISNID